MVGHDSKLPVLTDPAQEAFDFVEPTKYDVEYVGETVDGYGLFRRLEGHGGYSYWTDESGAGHCVFDEGLSNPITLFEALNHLGIGEQTWRHLAEVYGYKLK